MTSRVIAAPGSFKGTFDASAAARAIGEGIERAGLTADLCRVADGGEGTMSAIMAARGGRLVHAKAHDLIGRQIDAAFALIDDAHRAGRNRVSQRSGAAQAR
jgi:glycerate 2-kinase